MAPGALGARARALALVVVCARHAAAQIRIMSPQALVNNLGDHGRIQGSTATFGAPYFGQRVLGQLVYAESPPTAPHCTADDYDLNFCGAEGKSEAQQSENTDGTSAAQLINIFVIRRGGCSFVTKVKVAASKCAHAVVIVDRENSNMTAEDLKRVIVADDGYGDKIEIPSVLIDKFSGQKLINAVKNQEQGGKVVAELAWDIPAGDFVQVDMWISSASRESLKFLREFAPKRRVLNSVISFTPHYAVFGMDAGNPSVYNELCTEINGKFCAEDPDGAGPITGRDVLMEDVRQLCIHEKYKKVSNQGKVEFSPQFWDYIERLGEECPLETENPAAPHFGDECSRTLMAKVNIDTAAIDSCVQNTRDDKLQEQRDHPAWSPRALRINSWRYTGMLDTDLVIRAICSGFITVPKECNLLLDVSSKGLPPIEIPIPSSRGVSFLELLGWLALTLFLAFGALLLYKRYLKKEMRVTLREEVMLEVRNAMGEYRQMPS